VSTLLVETPTGERRELDGARLVRFGRSADVELTLGDPGTGAPMPNMSRHVGTFRRTDGEWWLDTPGEEGAASARTVRVFGLATTPVLVPPGCSTQLRDVGTIVFPPSQYTLRFRVSGAPAPPALPRPSAGSATERPLELTPRQVDFLVTLAEPELRQTPTAIRRSIPEVAALWRVKPNTVELCLRTLRERLSDVGELDADWNGRPGVTELLVRVAVELALVSHADLAWARLDDPLGPRRADTGPRFRTTAGGDA
jgi:hypothetical protein